MSTARLKYYGWGREGEGMSAEEQTFVLGRYHTKFGREAFQTAPVPRLEELSLHDPRVTPPPSLATFCTTERYDRAAHTYGKSYTDYVRAMLGQYDCAPDVVHPRNEAEISGHGLDRECWRFARAIRRRVERLRWRGTSQRWTAQGGHHRRPALSRQGAGGRRDIARRPDRRGAFGPALETQLKPHGLTLRHFPQSFEYSTLGGWIATRSGGHFASLYTHIDDFVENLRVVTPTGVLETRRLPGSGAGPSPDRMFIGSEGILGIISQAWMRLQSKPTFRAGGSVKFESFFAAASAVRAIAQAGLYPSNCRILDAAEAYNTGAGDGSVALLVLAFESGDHARCVDEARLECCADHGGVAEAGGADAHLEGAAGLWRNAFIRMPYAREFLAPAGIINDTFETSITWERFESLHDTVKGATERAILDATGVKGEVTCRFTHIYPDGPAPYFSFHALGRHGALLEQWRAIKDAASDALIAAGRTITHHHAVGRDHRPWYDRQRPELFATALRAAKRVLDPQGMMNPGVLIEP